MDEGLRDSLKRLYEGSSPTSRRFRVASLIFEIGLIGFFVLTSFASGQGWVAYAELAIGVVLLADFLVRWWIMEPPVTYFRHKKR